MKMNKEEFYDWIENKRIMNKVRSETNNTGSIYADYLFQKTIKAVANVQKVEEKSEEELLEQMSKLYECTDEGCKKFLRIQRKYKPDPNTPTYDSWLKRGRVARQYFGSERIERIWKEKKV